MSLLSADTSRASISAGRSITRTVSLAAVIVVHVGMFYAFVNGMALKDIFLTPKDLTLVTVPKPEWPKPEPVQIQPDVLPVMDFNPLVQPVIDVIDMPPMQVADAHPESADLAGLTPPVSESGVAGQGPVVEPFGIVTRVNPLYPAAAQRDGQQGTVLLNVVIGPEGRVTAVTVARSSGYMSLDDAAIAAVNKWRFTRPARGSVQVSLPVSFKLERVRR